PAALAAWRAYFAARTQPLPWFNHAGWASAVAGTPLAAETLATADTLLDRTVDFTDRALGKSGLYGFHYLGWLLPLIRAYALTGDERYIAGWTRFFDQWYATRDAVQGDWPGLDVIWYTLGVGVRSDPIAQALHAFRASPALPDATYQAMVKTLLGGARWLDEEHQTFRHGNWQLAGCGALLNLAGFLPEFREAGAWAATARARIEEHLALDVYPDGGHYERAPGYHAMCLGVLHRAAITAEQALDWPLAAHPRFAAMYDWLLALTTGGGWTPPFNDCQPVWSGVHLLYGYYFFARPAYKALARRLLSPETIAATLGALPPRPGRGDSADEFARAPEALPADGSRVLATSKYAVLRAGWEPDGLYAALNYGPFVGHELEPHSHLAGLDFVLAGWGAPLAWEAGGPNTYDDPLYYDWYRATRAHNTILAEGLHTGEDRDAELVRFAALPALDLITARHEGAGGAAHERTLIFVRPAEHGAPYWLVRDRVTGVTESTWLLHGRSPWLAGERLTFRSEEGPGLLVLPARPERLASSTGDTGPCKVPDPATGANVPGELHALALHAGDGRYDVVLAPFAATAPEAVVEEQGDDLVVRLAGCVDRFGERQWTRERDGRLLAAACWENSSLTYDDVTLVTGRNLRACSVHWTDNRLDAVVEVAARTTLALHAPGAAALRLNDIVLPLRLENDSVWVSLPCAGRYTIEVDCAHDGAQARQRRQP
ncbi:MAG TPA: heparinase II/III family protein, partial [Nitrolancea sp.]|nr:heparinase II/III family protein [Nitrolancea sp.]